MREVSIDDVVTFLEEEGIVTSEEIDLVTKINGHNMNTINDIIYVRTGCHDYEQLLDECGIEEEYEEED